MVVFYPNNIDTALEEGDYNFVASKTTLVIMKPGIGLEEPQMANHTPPVQSFTRALVNPPRIKRYYSHKHWNE